MPRAPRAEFRLDPDLRPDLVLEQKQILEVLQELKGVAGQMGEMKVQIRDLQTSLMGSAGAETPFGRLPMAEAKIAALTAEVDALKRTFAAEMEVLKRTQAADTARALAYWNTARIIGHVMTACGGGLVVALGEEIMRAFGAR